MTIFNDFGLNGSNKTRRNVPRNAARTKMNTFLKSRLNLDIIDNSQYFSFPEIFTQDKCTT